MIPAPAVLSRIDVSRNGVPCPDAEVKPQRWRPSQKLTDDITADLVEMHKKDAEFYNKA